MKFSNTMKILAVLLISLGATAQVQAQEEDTVDQFTLADVDGDECVSWEELRNRGALVFHSLDLNHDGVLAGEEHPEAFDFSKNLVRPDNVEMGTFQASLYVSLLVADKDENGCLSRAEYGIDE